MSTQINVRGEALKALMMILEDGRPSHLVIRDRLSALPEMDRRDRGFFTRLCEGTVEQLIRIDYVLGKCSSTPIRKTKPMIRTLLRMSVYQLLFMDSVPDSAVCNEAVKLAVKRGFSGLRGYVNGVLRGVCRLDPSETLPSLTTDRDAYLSVKYSTPLWLIKTLSETYGEDRLETILKGFLTERPVTARVNLSRVKKEQVIASLENEGVEAGSMENFAEVLMLKQTGNLAELTAMKEGWIQIQDIASMLPVFAANLQPGEAVLDVCAAPGGKSLHAADILGGTGHVYSRDLSQEKADMIRENVVRSKLTGITVSVHDATAYDPMFEKKADVVIADLPCSGLGIIGKKPDIKYRMTAEQINELALLQRQILTTVVRYVKPGGRLIFSTCTLSHEENRDNRRWFMESFPQFSPIPLEDDHFSLFGEASTGEGYIQLLPGIHPCDGFYVAAFRCSNHGIVS